MIFVNDLQIKVNVGNVFIMLSFFNKIKTKNNNAISGTYTIEAYSAGTIMIGKY